MPILILSLVFVLWLSYEIQKHNKAETKQQKNFWEHEYNANFARAKDISSLNYIIVPIHSLPFKDNTTPELMEIQTIIYSLAAKPILNLTGKTNTDLKYEYGIKNLESLICYDQNFLLLIRNLNKWAHLLYQNQRIEDAKNVLEYAISLKTDIRASYLLLANIYKAEENLDKINSLIKTAETLNTLLKPSILKELRSYHVS